MMSIEQLIPYSLKGDDWVAIILLVCFFLIAFVLVGNKKYFAQQGKNYILHKERTSFFSSSSVLSTGLSVLLVVQTCLMSSVVFFAYANYQNPEIVQDIHPYTLLGIYVLGALIYVFVKWILYNFISWIFFDKSITSLWLNAYSTLIYYLGFLLFPYVLLLVYFDFDAKIMLMFALIILIIAKILIFYKWLKFFFENIHGLFLLILYFCALEIIPCLIYYRAWLDINSLLLTKF